MIIRSPEDERECTRRFDEIEDALGDRLASREPVALEAFERLVLNTDVLNAFPNADQAKLRALRERIEARGGGQ